MSESGSLSSVFSKVKGVMHVAMYVTMGSMALAGIASLWASGVPVGAFDAVGMFLNMHIPRMEDLAMLGTAFEGVVNSASQGTWFTENFWSNPHDMHLGHTPSVTGIDLDAVVPDSAPLPTDTFESLDWRV